MNREMRAVIHVLVKIPSKCITGNIARGLDREPIKHGSQPSARDNTLSAIINPRHACAARVTVVVLCVCLFTTILALQATKRLLSDTNSFSATRA